MSDNTPLSLLERIRDGGEPTAWREFDAIYRPILRSYAKAWELGHADIDDVVQHCMTAIHANIGRFTHDNRVGRFRAWLRIMVNNHIKNLMARKAPSPMEEYDRNVQHREAPPEDAFARIWVQEHLRFYLDQVKSELGLEQFRAFEMYVLQQQAVEDVCRYCDCTANQLYKTKWRVTQRLRDKMYGLLDDE